MRSTVLAERSAPLVAAYVDVAGLKIVNDAHGHAAGDALLQRVVGKIRVICAPMT